jgi:hypothetical protein
VHLPATQRWPLEHAVPHAPQFKGSSLGTARPLHTRQSSTLPLQSLSTPSPHTSASANLRHAHSFRFVPSLLLKQAQLSAGGQFESALHACVHTPPAASTRTHRPDAQSSVCWHASPNELVPGDFWPAPAPGVQPPISNETAKSSQTARNTLSLHAPASLGKVALRITNYPPVTTLNPPHFIRGNGVSLERER